jgi:hypothetical protein
MMRVVEEERFRLEVLLRVLRSEILEADAAGDDESLSGLYQARRAAAQRLRELARRWPGKAR